jgi:hypothetical protein
MPAVSGREKERSMRKAIVALALALSACAGMRSMQSQDPLPGQSAGVIDRDGRQPASLEGSGP